MTSSCLRLSVGPARHLEHFVYNTSRHIQFVDTLSYANRCTSEMHCRTAPSDTQWWYRVAVTLNPLCRIPCDFSAAPTEDEQHLTLAHLASVPLRATAASASRSDSGARHPTRRSGQPRRGPRGGPYYTIQYNTILYATILYYTILYYTISYHTIPYHTILYYTIRYYTCTASRTAAGAAPGTACISAAHGSSIASPKCLMSLLNLP